MRFLAEALDDPAPQACGKCARCLGEPIVAYSFTESTAIRAARFLRRSEFPLKCNRQVPKDVFTEYSFQGNLPEGLRAKEGTNPFAMG